MKTFKILTAFFAVGLAWGQNPGAFRPPTFQAGVYPALNYTAGSINNGGHAQAIAAGSVNVATNASCAAPSFSACNFVYWPGSGSSLSITSTLGTAISSGNVLVVMVETDGGGTTITSLVQAWNSG